MALKNERGFAVDSRTGLIVPKNYKPPVHNYKKEKYLRSRSRGEVRQEMDGTVVDVDDDGIMFWPAYACGFDDFLMAAIVRGHMANTGTSGVLVPMLSTIVSKRQQMAASWDVVVRGRTSPASKAVDILAMADDGQGWSVFASSFIGNLDTYNSGAFIVQLPLAISLDKWPEYGFTHRYLDENDKSYSYLEVDEKQMRANFGLWSMDALMCKPTGNPEWPFWIWKESESEKIGTWVAIPRGIAHHVIQPIGPKSGMYPGYGQSGVWRFSPLIIESLLVRRYDLERLISSPPEGVFFVKGIDPPGTFRNAMESMAKDNKDQGNLVYPNTLFFEMSDFEGDIKYIPWREAPEGYTQREWDDLLVDQLVACFHMSVAQIRTKLGEGAMTQINITDAIESETAIAFMSRALEDIYNRVTPPRTSVRVVLKSSRQLSMQIANLNQFGQAMSYFKGKDGQSIFTTNEMRSMVADTLGWEIPEVEEEEREEPEEENEAQNSFATQEATGDWMPEEGDRVCTPMGTPCTLVRIEGEVAYVVFDWNKLFQNEHPYPLKELRHLDN